ncbi:hypothetical protein CMV_002833 [Castanea mollissima]|uniref:Uncharacterized protein n=1 Tax=Castanea mollissima TaxID=60419 RepID=A0A8J4RIH3_9ROSI|nr:hypothetical protein CMV_002833 [Castanea mollissima]
MLFPISSLQHIRKVQHLGILQEELLHQTKREFGCIKVRVVYWSHIPTEESRLLVRLVKDRLLKAKTVEHSTAECTMQAIVQVSSNS